MQSAIPIPLSEIVTRGPHFSSMKTMEDVLKRAAAQGLAETEALDSGMQEKAREFAQGGAHLYAKA